MRTLIESKATDGGALELFRDEVPDSSSVFTGAGCTFWMIQHTQPDGEASIVYDDVFEDDARRIFAASQGT